MSISYKIYENGDYLKTVTELTATITDLKPNTKYSFYVTETDGEDESSKSNVVEFTTSAIAVEAITLNSYSKSISKGSTFQLVATIKPSNATDQTITWSSSDNTIATVSSSGLITGIKSGTANIKATANNGKNVMCALTVTPIVKTPTNLITSKITADSVTLEWKKGV